MADHPRRSPAIEHLHREVEKDMRSFYSAFKHLTARTDNLPPPVAYTWTDEYGHPCFTHLAYMASHHKGRGKVVDGLHPECTVRRLLAEAETRGAHPYKVALQHILSEATKGHGSQAAALAKIAAIARGMT